MSEKQIQAVAKAYIQMLEAAKNKAEKEVEIKMDPVGQEDGDVDNDGDKDSSDEYLKNRRKEISKNVKKKDDTSSDSEMSERTCKRKMGESYEAEDGTVGTVIDVEESRFAVLFDDKVEWIEEAAHEEKAKNIQMKVPEGQEKLEPKAQGEKDFAAKHVVGQVKDEESEHEKDTKGMTAGVKGATKRPGDKGTNEPMKSVEKTTGQ
jgi:hypothetical protein